jgi:dipeptidyl-peptidase-4
VPRNFTVSPDGERVLFLRSPAGDDPATALWSFSVATGAETELASAATVLGTETEQLPPEERARRERSRELAGGIVAYACDRSVSHAAFALGGRLWWLGVGPPGPGEGGSPSGPVQLPAPPGVVDPRPSPTGRHVAFLSGPRLCLVDTSGATPWRPLAEEPGPRPGDDVTWGAAEFIAAEEMGRSRGFWWSPDGTSLLVARADSTAVGTWWTFDPSRPEVVPEAHRYPAAGTADAIVSLWHVPIAPGAPPAPVRWDAARFPYLAAVHWGPAGPPLLLVEQRDHKAAAVLAVDLGTGATTVVAGVEDEAWVGWVPGVPAWTDDGRLLWSAADAGTWRLKAGDEWLTPPGLQVREVTAAGQSIVFTASSEPERVEAWRWSSAGGLEQLTEAAGVSSAYGDGPVRVTVSRTMTGPGARAEVVVAGGPARALSNRAQLPAVYPAVQLLRVGQRQLSVGVVLPAEHQLGTSLPVLMAPYGGPGHQLVMASSSAWLEAQWFADQGFAVVVADGRGTPGRGPGFEREVYLDLASPVLQDQVDALQAAAAAVSDLDLSRVGIRGWSFGGYLSALAVLARPDVFHAAVAGAPVTDWQLYDTYYTERFLGHPDHHPEAYARTSLIPLAAGLRRPLLLVHGLADDNVYAAHTLALSSALVAAGRAHHVLPLPGITHVAGRDDIAERLLVAQVDFFRQHLVEAAPAP